MPIGGSSRGSRRQRRGEDVVHPLKVSLEDLYNGTSKKLSLARKVLCSKCKGYAFISCFLTHLFLVVYLYLSYIDVVFSSFCYRTGSKSGASMKCAGCQGSGVKVSVRQLGPGMIQQVQHACPQCKGSGML